MIQYFDRRGEEIDRAEYQRLWNDGQRRVLFDKFDNGWVSTIWLGYSVELDPRMVFETYISCDDSDELNCSQWRYASEAEAIEGHARAVTAYKAATGLTP